MAHWQDQQTPENHGDRQDLRIPPLGLPAILTVPQGAQGLVIFAHGSGSSRLSPRNNFVAAALNRAGFATLLFDLLLPEEEVDRRNVFDIPLLADRLADVVYWAQAQPAIGRLPVGLFGASTGAAAALVAAAKLQERVRAVVSRGGRPDLAAEALGQVKAPTLLIVGGDDFGVIELNEQAHEELRCNKVLEIVPGATHLFAEPGTMEQVVNLAIGWFGRHFEMPGNALS